jgi:RNA polymerase sigma-70 factor (ECF subfamily)
MLKPINSALLEAALEFEGVLRACLRRYVNNAADVEELLQETYAQLLEVRTPDKSEVRSVRGFALGVARNLALNWLRRRQIVSMESITDLEDLSDLEEGDQVERIVSAEQELALLVQAVESLPERCRQVFTLRKVYGFTQKEIAARLKISENTVEQHLVKAGRQCAQYLFERSAATPERNTLLARFHGRGEKP